MKRLKQFFKKFSFQQCLVVFLAGILLFTSTACGSGRVQAASPSDIGRPQPGQRMYPTTDVQQGQDTSKADAKADRLIREAKQRTQTKQNANGVVDQLTPDKPITEQAKEAAEGVKESTKEAAKNAAENTKQGLKNLQENTKNMVDQATEAIK